MLENIKVLFRGKEIELKEGNNVNGLICSEIYGIDGGVRGYGLYKVYEMYSQVDHLATIFLDRIEDSWISDKDIKIVVEQPQVAQNNTENKQGVILNYTPHTVNIIDSEGNKIQDFPSQGEARCQQTTTQAGTIGNIQITSTTFGEVTGLPEEKEGTYYIVSRLIRQALPERQDLLVPNEMVRDEAGRITGCRSLANN